MANALEVAPTELTEVTLPASGEPGTDLAQDAIRLALLAVGMGRPGGELLDTHTLTARVSDLLDAQQACQHDTVAAGLPGLIRDLHTSVAAGRYDGGLLELVTLLHVQGTEAWLRDVGAPLDLAWQAATLAQDAVRHGAKIGSNSWGDDVQGEYDLDAAQFDELVRDADPGTAGKLG